MADWLYFSLAILIGLAIQGIFLYWVKKKKEEYQYPIWAGILGFILFVVFSYIMFNIYGAQMNTWVLIVVSAIYIVSALVDFFNYLIPNRLSLAAFVLSLLFVSLNFSHAKLLLISGGIFLVVFALFYIISMGNFGMGDVKLSISMGVLLGMFGKMVVLDFLLWTFLSGVLVSIILLLLKIKKKEDKIAFGPYMVFSFLMLLIL